MNLAARDIRLTVNGNTYPVQTRGCDNLAQVLREQLNLTGTKVGCNAGECGACTVLMDDRAVCACLVPAARAEGARILTIESQAAESGAPSAIQQALIEHGAFQCGFCTPGVVMSLAALFAQCPSPTEQAIRVALQGNVCRCSGYVRIIEAAKALAQRARA